MRNNRKTVGATRMKKQWAG